MRFAFYISGKGGRLCKFLMQASDEEREQIALVVSEDVLPALTMEIIHRSRIKCCIFNYKELTGNNNKEKNIALSKLMLESFEENEIDYSFCFGRHILVGDLIRRYHYRMINFHSSILPMFPGVGAIDKAVESGKIFLLGNTAHFIDETVDGGPIIMQSVIPVQAFLDSDKDYDIVLDFQIEMIKKIMKFLNEGRITVEGRIVKITGADYCKGYIFPNIDLEEYGER